MLRYVKSTAATTAVLLLLVSSANAQFGNSKTGGNFQAPTNVPVNPPKPLAEVSRRADIENAYTFKSSPGIPGLTKYPRVNGSTSTIPIGQLLLARALGLNAELRRLAVNQNWGANFDSSPLVATFPIDADTSRLQEYAQVLPQQAHRQTNGAYNALATGEADLILVAREPSADESALAKQTKAEFDIRPVALDGLIFFTNRKNPLSGLSLDQIRDIYSGQIKRWNEVGGQDASIFAITRDPNSGSQELIQKLVMGQQKMIEGRNRVAHSMMGTLDMAERNADSIAFSVFYYERIMNARDSIKPLKINGVLPTSQTIADRTYPLVEPVYMVTRKDITSDGPAAKLRNWLLSQDGQKLIAQSGYVPITKID